MTRVFHNTSLAWRWRLWCIPVKLTLFFGGGERLGCGWRGLAFAGGFCRPATAIVVGTEQYGLSDIWMQAADLQVRIPMRGKLDSLNVAAAATILLFEAARQRQNKD